jgi:hypothetical protein
LKLNSRRCLRWFSGGSYDLRTVRDQQTKHRFLSSRCNQHLNTHFLNFLTTKNHRNYTRTLFKSMLASVQPLIGSLRNRKPAQPPC